MKLTSQMLCGNFPWVCKIFNFLLNRRQQTQREWKQQQKTTAPKWLCTVGPDGSAAANTEGALTWKAKWKEVALHRRHTKPSDNQKWPQRFSKHFLNLICMSAVYILFSFLYLPFLLIFCHMVWLLCTLPYTNALTLCWQKAKPVIFFRCPNSFTVLSVIVLLFWRHHYYAQLPEKSNRGISICCCLLSIWIHLRSRRNKCGKWSN